MELFKTSCKALEGEMLENVEMFEELVEHLSRRIFCEVPCPEYMPLYQKAIYLATASPDDPLTIIRLEDASYYLPCFDEADLLYGLPQAPIMMSYCPREVLWIENKRYLTGSMVFFRVDEASRTVSLGLDDLPLLLEFLKEHQTVLEAGNESFMAIRLD